MKTKTHTFRSLAIALMAILMCVFYVLGPLQNQIPDWSHTLSHKIENFNKKTFRLAEHENHYHSHHTLDNHKDKSEVHSHNVVDLIASFLESATDKESSEKSFFTSIKIDKHFVTYSQDLNLPYLKAVHKKSIVIKNNAPNEMHLQKLIKPPAYGVN